MTFEDALKPLLGRVRTRYWIDHTTRAFCAAGVAMFALSVMSWLFIIEPRSVLILGAGTFVLLAWMMAGFSRVPGYVEAARAGDLAGLKERLLTALELQESGLAVHVAQRRDALSRLSTMDTREAVPYAVPRRPVMVATCLIVLSVASLVLPYRFQSEIDRRQAFRDEMKRQADALQTERRKLDSQEPARKLAAAQAIKELKELEDRLRMTTKPEDAAVALSEAESRLRDIVTAQDRLTASGTLSAVKDGLSSSSITRGAAERARNEDLRGAAQELSKAAGDLNKASPGEKALAADALENMEAAMTAMGAGNSRISKSAARAAKALASGTPTEAEDALDELADELDEAADAKDASDAAASASAAIANARYGMLSAQAGSAAGAGQGLSGQGQGGGSSGAGSGSTNQGGTVGAEAPHGTQGSGSGISTGRQGIYERIYAPERVGGIGDASTVRGRAGAGQSDIVSTGQGRQPSAHSRPYSDVFASFQKSAIEGLDRSAVPSGMRDYVRRYFSSLEPGR